MNTNVKKEKDVNNEQVSEFQALQPSGKHVETLEAFRLDTNQDSSSDVYSNSIQRIELAPRFYRGKGARKPFSDPNRLSEFENEFSVNGEKFVATIFPATISVSTKDESDETGEQSHSQKMSCFPSDSEELIERTIFLLAAQKGLQRKIIGGNYRYCINFSIYEIYNILESIGKTRSYKQILESLRIIRDSKTIISKIDPNNPNRRIEITHNIWSDSIIEVSGHGRGRDQCSIAFSDFVVDEILNLNYRQVLFSRLSVYKSTLSRFLDLYLTHNWLNVDINSIKDLSTNEIMAAFGKSDKSIVTKRRDMYKAIDHLVESGVILKRTNAITKKDIDGNTDIIFSIQPTKNFVEDVISANKKRKGLKTKLLNF